MELDEVTSYGRLLVESKEEDITESALQSSRNRELHQLSHITSRTDAVQALSSQLSAKRAGSLSLEKYELDEIALESDSESSVDADDFIRPPDLDPPDNELERFRSISPGRLARRRQRKRTLSVASQHQKRKNRTARLFRKFTTKSTKTLTDSSSDSDDATSITSRRSTVISGVSSKFSSRSKPVWKFWRGGTDTSSSTSSRTHADSEDSDLEAVEPSYTLMVPNMDTPASDEERPFYSLEKEAKLAPALAALQQHWRDRQESEGGAGDLGQTAATIPVQRPLASGIPIPRVGEGKYAGPAWWLDVLCPSTQDMRALRKVLPFHPLTIEDILHEDPAEKYEIFDKLGYEFVTIRALDERYFQFRNASNLEFGQTRATQGIHSTDRRGAYATRSKPRVKIVEGVGGKEGVEGVGVGAIDLYLVIYDDGIISFHTEDLDKHMSGVQTKMQRLASNGTRVVTSHWIAYGLIDSIVDAFVPLLNYIETEYTNIDSFLADPLADRRIHNGFLRTSDPVRHVEVRKTQTWFSFPGTYLLALPKHLLWLTPGCLIREHHKSKTLDYVYKEHQLIQIDPIKRQTALGDQLGKNLEYNPSKLLEQIAHSRQLVTGLSRIMMPKKDVVAGLRKRHKTFGEISLYWGDLHDHVMAMQHSLTFYEVVMAHDHPVLVGLFRLALENTKNHTDKLITRVYVITLAFLAFNLITGAFSLNVIVPHNGEWSTHKEPDGSTPPFLWFGIVISMVLVLALVLGLFIRSQFLALKKRSHRLATL